MPDTTVAFAAPVAQSERIEIIDALRGFAILGILLMNIPGFAMAGRSSYDPTVMHEIGTLNFKLWHFVEWFPEGTQRAIFSMLFGAGIILFSTRQEKKLPGALPADYFLRRQLWLMVFGIFDVFILLWWGDILFDYACYGIIMYVFRKLPVKWLLIAAGISLLLMLVRENRDFYLEKRTITRGEMVAAMDTTRVKLTDKQQGQLTAMNEFKDDCTPDAKQKNFKKSITRMTGSYEDLYETRTGAYLNYMLVRFTYLSIWDVVAFMFLGMAFFKMGVLTGQASYRFYWIMAIVGLVVGLTLSYLRLKPLIDYRFNEYEYTKHTRIQVYTLSRIFRSLGIFGSLMLMYKSGLFKWFFRLLRPVGQMAFTNYLTQSLVCGLIFYGIGFGMFGKLSRIQVYEVVLAVWVLQIIWSHVWLHFFNFGPLEWCWRSLTYWKRQPMKKEKN